MSENYITGKTKSAVPDHQVLLGKLFCPPGVLPRNKYILMNEEGRTRELDIISFFRSSSQQQPEMN